MSTLADDSLQRRNQRLTLRIALVALFFAGFGFALVPLYDVFCQMTGFNGKTNATAAVLARNTQVDSTRWVKVEFLSQTMPGVPLEFAPEQFSVKVHPGGLTQVNYIVRNLSNKAFTGRAIPSVTPAMAATHFQKIECFCFSEQTFLPGETRTMPVVFVVDRELGQDLGTVTLSYAFFETPKAPA